MPGNRIDTYKVVPAEEIFRRISTLQNRLRKTDLCGALIPDRLNMYYFTGTMQQGVLFIPTEDEPVFFIRRSIERARQETPLKRIVSLKGMGELPDAMKTFHLGTTPLGVNEGAFSVSLYKRLQKVFSGSTLKDIGPVIAMVRAVKSDYEVGLIRQAGVKQERVFQAIPDMVNEGMSEWELGSAIHRKMLELGHTGIARLSAFGEELFMGIISFGESGNYPTASVGPGGVVGLSPAFPFVGGTRKLRRGEPIFVDTGFGYEGYFTDKTRVYCIGSPPSLAADAHERCLEIQEAIRCRLKPGAIPSQIYEDVYQSFVYPRGFEKHFMGFGSNQVSFLGHGIGLAVDEFPAIAKKVHTPLETNMVIALEPKKGIEGIGLVGIENTFLVTETGGEKLTPGADALIIV